MISRSLLAATMVTCLSHAFGFAPSNLVIPAGRRAPVAAFRAVRNFLLAPSSQRRAPRAVGLSTLIEGSLVECADAQSIQVCASIWPLNERERCRTLPVCDGYAW